MKLLLSLLLVTASAMTLHAQSPMPNKRINNDPPGAQQGGPRVAVDRSGVIYVAWTDFRTNNKGDIYLSRSTDGGSTFSQNMPVYTGGAVPAGMQRGVTMAIDSLGGIHMVWMEVKRSSLPELRYIRSIDGGMTFSDPIYIGGPMGVSAQDFPSMGIDAANNIYIAWVDDRETRNGTGTNTQIYLTRSTDRGASFGNPMRASIMPNGVGGSCECCNTSMAVSAGGHIYISFRSNINNRRDIFVARSLDRGESFDVAIPAASERWMLQACPMSGSAIALDNEETAHIVWRDSRPSSKGKDFIYHAMLFYGASSCTPDMQISATPSKSNFPAIVTTPEGGIYCAFQDNRNDLSDILLVTSSDGGNSFSAPSKLVDDQGSASQVEVVTAIGPDGARYSVWRDERRDAGDIYFTKDAAPFTLLVPDPVSPIAPADGAVIETFQKLSWSQPANLVDARNVAYDLTITKDGVPALISDIRATSYATQLSPGTYTWFLVTHTPTGRSTPSDTFSFTLQSGQGSSVPSPSASGSLRLHDIVLHPGSERLRVSFDLEKPELVSFTIIGIDGTTVMTLESRHYEPGEQSESLEVGSLPSGIYLLEARSSSARSGGKFIVVR